MKKITCFILTIFCIFCSTATAITVHKCDGTVYETKQSNKCSQKYNPHCRKWETVPDNWTTKYNPHEGTWSYQPDGAKTVYNAHEGTWDWDSGYNN